MPKSSFRSPLPQWPSDEPRPSHRRVHHGVPGDTANALAPAARCKQSGLLHEARICPLVSVVKGTHVSLMWSEGGYAEPHN